MPAPTKSKLDNAEALAAAGFFVFPLQTNGKAPPKGMHFKELATRDPAQIKKWWGAGEFNIGIYTGKFGDDGALVVVDIDEKAGRNGPETAKQLEAVGFEFPDTREHETASGGLHVFYQHPAPVSQGTDKLGPGLDVRSRGGYVVAPGSTIDGKPYSVLSGVPVAPAPSWLIDKCGEAPARQNGPDKPAVAVPEGSAAQRARQWLTEQAPVAIEGQGGDATTYKVAARLRDYGLPEAAALNLMLEIWDGRCEPPWGTDELGKKVANAYRYSRDTQGNASPQAVFDPVPVPPADKPKNDGKLFFELLDDVTPQISKPALVEGLLDHGAMSVLYGESNTGKTFIALDIGFHVAAGRPWQGRAVESGAVIYVAAEGGGNIRKRFAALRTYYGQDAQGAPLALIPCPVDLSGAGADVAGLIEQIGAVRKQTGKAPALVVIDTLSRALAGGNENAPDDMGAFVRNVDRIRNVTKTHLLIVHHSGKDKARGARGHSSLRAATDTEIEIADRTITATKQRDQEIGKPFGFELRPVGIGADHRGRPVTSCVVVARALTAGLDFKRKPLRKDSAAAKMLAEIRLIIEKEGESAPEALGLRNRTKVIRHLSAKLSGHFSRSKSPDAQRKAIKRALENLTPHYIGQHGDFTWITE